MNNSTFSGILFKESKKLKKIIERFYFLIENTLYYKKVKKT